MSIREDFLDLIEDRMTICQCRRHLNDLADIKSKILRKPYSLERPKKHQAEDSIYEILQRIQEQSLENNPGFVLVLESLVGTGESRIIRQRISQELSDHQQQLSADIVTAYVRNCYVASLIRQQGTVSNSELKVVNRIFQHHELCLHYYALDKLHTYVKKLAMDRTDVIDRFRNERGISLLCLHGARRENLPVLISHVNVVFRNLPSVGQFGQTTWTWPRVATALMLLADAMISYINQNGGYKLCPMQIRINVAAIISSVASFVEPFFTQKHMWNVLDGINMSVRLPGFGVQQIDAQDVSDEELNRIITSVKNPEFKGVCSPLVPSLNLLTLLAIPGKTAEEKKYYVKHELGFDQGAVFKDFPY